MPSIQSFLQKKINLVLLFSVSIIVIIIISGCNPIKRQGNFKNLTEQERQQMIEQRMQMMQAACQGKAEGDSCSVQSPRGERKGTCKTQNETLACSTGANNRDGNPSGANAQ